jgi:acyl carrier protein
VDVERRVKKVIARHLKTDEDKIHPDSDFTRDLGAESIQSIELIAAFEEEFNIEMDDQAALAVRAVGDAVEFIKKVIDESGRKVQ